MVDTTTSPALPDDVTAPARGARAWLARAFPELTLPRELRAELARERRDVMRARARRWGVVLLVLELATVLFYANLAVDTPAALLWRRGLVQIHATFEAIDVVVIACVFVDRGAARLVADRVGPILQGVGLIGFALMAANAQRTHGSLAAYLAMLFAAPLMFRASSAWFVAMVAVSSAVLTAGVAALQPSATLRANAIAVVAGWAFAGVVTARMYAASVVRELRARAALRQLNGELEARVAAQTRELRQFATRLDEVLEGERRRLARELHDDLGQELTALRFEVEALRPTAPDARARDALERMGGALERSHQSVRAILESLRPRILDEEGLAESIQWLARHFRARSRCACDVDVVLYDEPDPDVGLALFRIAQESLTNVARHARASRVAVSLTGDDAGLRLVVEDDGPPGADAAMQPGRGMTGMRERALSIGGALEIQRQAARGTRVVATAPWAAAGAVPS